MMLLLRSLVVALAWALPLAGGYAASVRIPASQHVVDGEGLRPGTLVLLDAGQRDVLVLKGLRGTAEHPIVVANHSGQVRAINDHRGFAIAIRDCRHVRLTGSGDPALEYGIEAQALRTGMSAVHVVDRSSYITIDHVLVSGAGFAGFNVKDEPKPDGSTNRGAYVMEGINLHHNLVRDVEGEGFYVGHTFYHGHKQQDGSVLYPHQMRDVRIHHNHIENTGCEGIQVGSTIAGLEVTDNVVIKPGQRPFMKWQDNGIQINAAGDILIARNVIIAPPANGIIGGPLEDDYRLRIERNLVVDPGGYIGYLGGTEHGAGGTVEILHNTFVGGGKGGYRIANPQLASVVAANNLLVAPGGAPWFLPGGDTQVREAGNLVVAERHQAGLVDPSTGDGELLPGSPARGRGVDLGPLVVGPDLLGRHDVRGRIDVGAWAASGRSPQAEDQADRGAETQAAESTPAPPLPDPAVWRPQLVAALRNALQQGDEPALHLRGDGQRFTIRGIDDDDRLQLAASGVTMVFPLASLRPEAAGRLAAELGLSDLAARLTAADTR